MCICILMHKYIYIYYRYFGIVNGLCFSLCVGLGLLPGLVLAWSQAWPLPWSWLGSYSCSALFSHGTKARVKAFSYIYIYICIYKILRYTWVRIHIFIMQPCQYTQRILLFILVKKTSGHVHRLRLQRRQAGSYRRQDETLSCCVF